MTTASLTCGAVLAYGSRTFVPVPGERVPCRSHGHGDVTGRGVTGPRSTRRPRRVRARPRTREELMAWLLDQPRTTPGSLRRHRFTLRMVVAAGRDGLLTVDLEAGTVVRR